MTKLNQILAVEKGTKQRVQRDLTDIHKRSQKPDLYEGMVRTYEPLYEDGEKLPPQEKNIQLRANEVLDKVSEVLTELFDVTATKDKTNTVTKAKVQVGDKVLVDDVPVSYLLFLEKQLNDIDTFVRKLPTLDPSVEWRWSNEKNCYETEATWQNRTEKVPEPVVLHEGNEHHPPQTKLEYRDKPIGKYTTIRFAASLPAKTKEEILNRITRLKNAVKTAREEANAVEVTRMKVGEQIFDYILNG